MLTRFSCWFRRHTRRHIWLLLGIALVPAYLLLRSTLLLDATQSLPPDATHEEVAETVAVTMARVVDFPSLLSKTSAAIIAFVLINFLAWSSLYVFAVVRNWVTGYYSKVENAVAAGLAGPIDDFKLAFLKFSSIQRTAVYIAIWGIELFVASRCVEAAFTMQ